MKVRYAGRATRDLDHIHRYLIARSPRGAVSVMTALYAGIEFIRRNPVGAPEVARLPGVRSRVVRRYHYRIFYRILAAEQIVEIVHIRHTSRRPWEGE